MQVMEIKRTIEVTVNFPQIGEKIRNARKLDKRSLTQLCEEIGISRTYWYQLEKEALLLPVSEDVIRKIESVLNIDLGIDFTK